MTRDSRGQTATRDPTQQIDFISPTVSRWRNWRVAGVLLVVYAAFAGLLLLRVSAVYVAAAILTFEAVVYALYNPPRQRVWVLLLFITFPVTIQVFGNDAFSTGTLLIAMLLLAHWVTRERPAALTGNTLKIILVALLLIAAYGVIAGMPEGYMSAGFRRWVDLASSIGAFLLVVGWAGASEENERRSFIEAAITSLLLIAALHVLISLALRWWPSIESYFSVFLKRQQETLGVVSEASLFGRSTTTFTQTEGFGEFLMFVFPLALYKLFTGRVRLFLPVLMILMFGALYAATRSALLLMLGQLVAFVALLALQRKRATHFTIAAAAILLVGAAATVATSVIDPVITRFADTTELLTAGANLSEVLNRERVWSNASWVVRSTLSWLGHGPIQAYKVGIGTRNFHSLYMTLVYQFGIIGTAIWAGFFMHLIRRLWLGFRRAGLQGNTKTLLVGACFLSLIGFLVNEIKFEFNRADSYQQIVWVLFALFYIAAGTVGKSRKQSRIDERE